MSNRIHIPYTKKLGHTEQLVVFREIKCNPDTDHTKLAKYFDTTEKEIKRAWLKGLMLKWK